MALHTHAHDGDFGHFLFVVDILHIVAEAVKGPFDMLDLGLGNGEVDLGLAVGADGLDDHIDVDVLFGQGVEDFAGDAGAIFDPFEADAGLVFIQGDAADEWFFHDVLFLCDQSSGIVVEAAAGDKIDPHLFGQFDGSVLQHLGPQRGQLQHLVVADAIHLFGFGLDPRVGGVDPVDVGVDFTQVRFHRSGDGHGGQVAAAPAQGRDATVGIDALKSGDDDDFALFQLPAHRFGIDLFDPCGGVALVGDDTGLPSRHRHGGISHLVERNAQQRTGDPLSGA